MSSHASSTSPKPPLALRRVRHPPPDGVQGEQRAGGFGLVGEVPEAEHDEVPVGPGGGRPVEQPPVRPRHIGGEAGGEGAGGRIAVCVERGGEVTEQRCGAGVATGIGGDPRLLVGRDDPPVERGGGRRVGLLAEQHGDEGVDEQRPAHHRPRRERPAGLIAGVVSEGVVALPASTRATAEASRGLSVEVEGVDPHPWGAEVHVGAADGLGEAAVLVFGVDDGDLDPLVEGAQRFEFGEVGLARARAGEDDRVVVVLGEAVPRDEPGARRGGAVEDAGGGR